MKEKDAFLIDALLAPSGLFGDAVDSVVDRYQEARKQAVAFQLFLYLYLQPFYNSRGCWAGSPNRVPAPHTGRFKSRALPLVLARSGTEVDAL